MNTFQRYLRIYGLFSLYSIKSMLQGRMSIVLFTLGKIIRFLMFFLFIYFLVSQTDTLKGYTVNQVIIFYLTFNIVDSLSQMLFREVYRFRQLVVKGELDGVLTKPYHPFLRILLGGLDVLDSFITIPYIILTIIFFSFIPEVTTISLIIYLLMILNAIIIAAAFHIFVLAFGILTTSVDHGMMIFRDIISTGRFPIEIYREPIRWILTFVLPVGIMMSFPAQAVFGRLSTLAIMMSFVISFSALFLSVKLWTFALRRYQSWGG